MPFINVGAYVNDERPKTKKALKEAVKSDPANVYFDGTSALAAPGDPGGYAPDDLEGTNIRLQVCGPDPFSKRSWYATVEHKNGMLLVS